jgi:LmbE family N-acetylglucosaminyl deacetylase
MMVTIKKPTHPVDALFVSPHLDDAALSAGGKIIQLVNQGKRVCVATVCTQGSDASLTADGAKFLRMCGKTSARSLFSTRKKEDQDALHVLGAEHVHLGFFDGLYRTRTIRFQEKPIYPSFRSVFSGHLSRHDDTLMKYLIKTLKALKKTTVAETSAVFAPLGAGGHVDHILTREAVCSVFRNQTIFWEDVPYRWDALRVFRQRMILEARLGKLSHEIVDTSMYSEQKHHAVAQYQSQLSDLTEEGLGSIDFSYEVYYTQA